VLVLISASVPNNLIENLPILWQVGCEPRHNFGVCPMADLAGLGQMPAAWRYREARRSRAIRRRITASVAEVGDRAAAWLSAQRATFRARLFLL
jgi:hypothetical protein